MDKMDFIGELATSLGMGEIPILNHTNKSLHQKLISCQIECETVKVKNVSEEESINRIFGHVNNIKDAYTATKHLVIATKVNTFRKIKLTFKLLHNINYFFA